MTKAENEQFALEIQAGGFYTNGLCPVGSDLFSTIVCAKKLSGGQGYSGNSFWVTRFGGHWYLGTWGVRHYLVPEHRSVVEICLAWLRRQPDGTTTDFDQALKTEFDLVPLSIEEFEGRWSALDLSSENHAE